MPESELKTKLVAPQNIRADAPTSAFAHMPGQITAKIGSGVHAQESIVWLIIRYCFYFGGGITVLLAVLPFFRSSSTFQTDDIIKVWSIFGPLLSLALGYLFGKH
jgi:hypothetical protein